MAIIMLIRQEHFSASHRLYHAGYNKAWNTKTYGRCSRPHGHGHNYILEVSVCGIPDTTTGMIMNLKQLKLILQKKILSKVDHTHLNYDVDFLKNIIPTTENVALAFWNELDQAIPKKKLYKLKLWETEKNSVEILRS